jgi:hypothetical protein
MRVQLRFALLPEVVGEEKQGPLGEAGLRKEET